MDLWDVLIAGGGPAGLSCALVLGRCRRRVLVVDHGQPRNAVSHASHGFFSRDGIPPHELIRIGREQLAPYGVQLLDGTVQNARPMPYGFDVELQDGSQFACRKLVLATGLKDRLPAVEGFDAFYGRSIWHCPYCDGWEARDQPLAAYARGKDGVDFALGLQTWSTDIILLTDGARRLDMRSKQALLQHRIPWYPQKVLRFEGTNGQLERVVFSDGTDIRRRGLFFHLGTEQCSPLAARLGCAFDKRGAVKTISLGEETGIPNLHVIGDASEDAMLIVVAASEGAKAAVSINKKLRIEMNRRAEKEHANEPEMPSPSP